MSLTAGLKPSSMAASRCSACQPQDRYKRRRGGSGVAGLSVSCALVLRSHARDVRASRRAGSRPYM